MGDIINSKKFDELYNRIVWVELLDKELDIYKQPLKDFVKNKFLCKNTFIVYYENQEYRVMTEAYYNQLKSEKYI